MNKKTAFVASGLAAVVGLTVGLGVTSASATVDTTYYTARSYVSVPANSSSNTDAMCNEGDTAMGGGAMLTNSTAGSYTGDQPWITGGYPGTAIGWTGLFYNDESYAQYGYAYAICKDT